MRGNTAWLPSLRLTLMSLRSLLVPRSLNVTSQSAFGTERSACGDARRPFDAGGPLWRCPPDRIESMRSIVSSSVQPVARSSPALDAACRLHCACGGSVSSADSSLGPLTAAAGTVRLPLLPQIARRVALRLQIRSGHRSWHA